MRPRSLALRSLTSCLLLVACGRTPPDPDVAPSGARPRAEWLPSPDAPLFPLPPALSRPPAGADQLPPLLTGWAASPDRARAGTIVELSFESDEPLPEGGRAGANPDVRFAGVPLRCSSSELRFSCSVEATPSMSEREHGFQVAAADVYGNTTGWLQPAPRVVLDFTLPALTVTPARAVVGQGEPVSFLVEASEPLGATPGLGASFLAGQPVCAGVVPGTRFSCEGVISSGAPPGAGSVTAQGVDLAGNGGESPPARLVVQERLVVVLEPVLPDPARDGATLRIALTANEPLERCSATVAGRMAPCDAPVGASCSCSLRVDASLPEGLATIVARAWSSTVSAETEGSVEIDRTPPSLRLIRPLSGERRGGTMTVEVASFDAAPAELVELFAGGRLVGSVAGVPPWLLVVDTGAFPDGALALEVRASDPAGNAGSAGVGIVVDNSPPQLSFVAPVAGALLRSGAGVRVEATDLAGIAWIESEGSAAASSPLLYLLHLAGAPDGARTLTATAWDRTIVDDDLSSGNMASAEVAIEVDGTPPLVSISVPADGESVSGQVLVSALASDTRALGEVRLWAGALLLATLPAPGPYEASWDSAAGLEGVKELRAEALDVAGNLGTATIRVEVDNSPPWRCRVTAPASGSVLSAPVSLEGNGEDVTGLRELEFFVDGVSVGTVPGATGGVSWDPGGVADGSHEVQVRCTDVFGYVRSSTPRTVVVDTTAPMVTITEPAVGEEVLHRVLVRATATDASPIARLEFSVAGRAPVADDAAPFEASVDLTGLGASVVLRAEAFDAAGNSALAEVSVVQVVGARFRTAEYWAGTHRFADAGTAGDLDGDGKPDLVIGGSELSWRRGAGAGWDPPVRLGSGGDTTNLADVDGDGDLDLIIRGIGWNVGLVENLGGGAFAPWRTIWTVAFPGDVGLDVGDLDGDGAPDLVLACAARRCDVAVVWNRGGLFVAGPTLGTSGDSTDVQLGDLDGDGDRDIALSRSGLGLTVYLNDGAGNFGAGIDSPTPNLRTRLAIADLDGDGVAELLVTSEASHTLGVLTGTAGSYVPSASHETGRRAGAVTAADVDLDGDLDVVMTADGGFQLFVNDAGLLTAGAQYVTGGYDDPVLLDLDGDGWLELIQAAQGGVSVARGSGGGRFHAAPTFDLADVQADGTRVHRQLTALAAGNLTQAPGLDLAVGLARGGGTMLSPELWILENDGAGAFVLAHRQALTAFGAPPPPACVGDADCPSGWTCRWGTCQEPELLLLRELVVGELDGQHGLDLAALGQGSSEWFPTLFPALPGGGYGRTTISGSLVPAPSAVAIADPDNDGQGEAVFATRGAPGNPASVVMIEADGSTTSLLAGSELYGMSIADLDGDGDRDLVVAARADLYVWLWSPAGFAAPLVLPSGTSAYWVAVGSSGGDGSPDLVCSSGTYLSSLLGEPGAVFGAPTVSQTAMYSNSLLLEDFNGDGLDDALLVAEDSPELLVLIARTGGGFLEPERFAIGGNALGPPVLGDFDGDGRMDVAVAADQVGSVVTLLLNDG